MSPEDIREYHAHIYYDAETRRAAAELRAALADCFNVALGRWRDEPVGLLIKLLYNWDSCRVYMNKLPNNSLQ